MKDLPLLTITQLRRFSRKFEPVASGCWEWQRAKSQDGYPIHALAPNKVFVAHRLLYRQIHGRIDNSLQIDHLCRNRACVNPSHLEAVTVAENLSREFRAMSQRVTERSYCRNGHQLADGNVTIEHSRGRKDYKRCVTCRLASR